MKNFIQDAVRRLLHAAGFTARFTARFRSGLAAVVALAPALMIGGWAPTAHAQSNDEVEVSYGGWSAFGGFVTYSALTPLARYATAAVLAPSDPRVCAVEPEQCEPGAGRYALAGLTMLTHLGLGVAGGWAAGEVAEAVDIDAGLGWGLAGGMLGVPTMGLIAYALPRYDAEWLWTTQTMILLAAGAGGGGFAFWAIANERGHAWPEFIGGSAGMVLGLGLGTLFCGDEGGCAAVPLMGGLGALVGAGVTGFAWGYEPAPGADSAEIIEGALVPYQLHLAF